LRLEQLSTHRLYRSPVDYIPHEFETSKKRCLEINRVTDGVICGHVHTPEMRTINGIEYYNDGDWVESCSALVEHFDGTMELIRWHTIMSGRDKKIMPITSPDMTSKTQVGTLVGDVVFVD